MKFITLILVALGLTTGAAYAGPLDAAEFVNRVQMWSCTSRPDTVGRVSTQSYLNMGFRPGNTMQIMQKESIIIDRKAYSRMISMHGDLTPIEDGFVFTASKIDVESSDPLPGLRRWMRPYSMELIVDRKDGVIPAAYGINGTSNTTEGDMDVSCIVHQLK